MPPELDTLLKEAFRSGGVNVIEVSIDALRIGCLNGIAASVLSNGLDFSPER